ERGMAARAHEPDHFAEGLTSASRRRAPDHDVAVRGQPAGNDLSILRLRGHGHDALPAVLLDGKEHPAVPERKENGNATLPESEVMLSFPHLDTERRAIKEQEPSNEPGEQAGEPHRCRAARRARPIGPPKPRNARRSSRRPGE